MEKILVVCTTDSMIWNFLVPHILDLQQKGFTVECACSETGDFFSKLRNEFSFRMYRMNFQRSPYDFRNFGAYRQLIDWYRMGDLDFSGIRSVNLDEYLGLSADDPRSYACFMRKNLFDAINIKPENTFIPDGCATDPTEECARYNQLIRTLGGIDLQLLGIGNNGHIGFNEPGDCFAKETHPVRLTENTIAANARFFSSVEEVPKYALSTGIKNIMQAKRILLIASGTAKAEALFSTICGPITPAVPASILQLHENVTIVADEAALALVPDQTEELL